MKNNLVIEIEERIKKVKDKIENVKFFKNLKLFSSIKIYNDHFLVVYDPGTLTYSFMDRELLSAIKAPFRDLDDMRNYCIYVYEQNSNIILMGDPLIEDLEEDLKLLNDLLKIECMKITDDISNYINIAEAPDGWYIIKNSPIPMDTNIVKEGDCIFIKRGWVYIQDHKRFKSYESRDVFCVRGFDKRYWDNYTCVKM